MNCTIKHTIYIDLGKEFGSEERPCSYIIYGLSFSVDDMIRCDEHISIVCIVDIIVANIR